MTTTMQEAFKRAGYESDQGRLRRLAEEASTLGEFLRALEADNAATLCLFESDEILARARRYHSVAQRQSEMRSGGGHYHRTDGQNGRTPAGTHANETRSGGHASHTSGQGANTTGARPLTGSEAGHRTVAGDGHTSGTRFAPGHARPISQATKAALAVTAENTVLDSFAIIDRNGERLVLGDIYVSSYDQLIKHTAKRSWRASREYALLTLLKAEAERSAAYVPPETKTRDIFAAEMVEKLLATATTLATPQLPETEAA